MSSLTDITMALQIFGISIVSLAGLLLLIRIFERILRRLALHHVTSTDLDLIGKRAVVTSTIRPTRPGKINCRDAAGAECVVEACSDHVIHRGRVVLITAVESGRLRVLPVPGEAAARGRAE